MYYIFSFRSRHESMCFYERCTKVTIATKIIATPRVISIGCGLSVKVGCDDIAAASELLGICGYNTLLGQFYFDGKNYTRVQVYTQ